jgi:hypothetical protein
VSWGFVVEKERLLDMGRKVEEGRHTQSWQKLTRKPSTYGNPRSAAAGQ